MTHQFNCPDCGREHSEPADAAFVLTVLCADCDLGARLELHVKSTAAVSQRAIAAAA
jgi:transcription elongation factor Elf1